MSLRDEIFRYLSEFYDVRKVVVDREWVSHGVPSTKVEVYWLSDGTRLVSTCTFDKSNNMDATHMATVLSSYMRKKDYFDA